MPPLRALLLPALLLSGCGVFREVGLAPADMDHEAVKKAPAARAEPDRVVVRHVLLSFENAGPPTVTRTKEEAERLAQQVLAKARAGHDFAELVRLYSDDRHGDGSYAMSNWGVPPRPGERDREGMVRGFGRIAFSLEVGEVGLVPWDAAESPFGWHVMRRIE